MRSKYFLRFSNAPTNKRNLSLFGRTVAVTMLFGTVAMGLGTLSAAKVLHTGMIVRTLRSPMSFFDTTPIGRVVNRFAKDIDTIDNTLPNTLRSMMTTFLSVSRNALECCLLLL